MQSKLRLAIWTAAGILLIVSVYLGATLHYERQAAEEIAHFVADSRFIKEMQYEELHVGLFRREITLRKIRVQTTYLSSPALIASITLQLDRNDDVQQRGAMRCSGIQLSLDRQWVAAVDPLLKDLGFDEIESELELHFQVDRSQKTCRFDPIHLSVKDAFQMSMEVGLDGLLPEDIPRVLQNPFLLLKDFQNAALQGLRIVYDEFSLFSRLTDAISRKRGISRNDQIAAWGQEIERQIAMSQTNVSKAMWQAAGEFIRNPKRIGIRLQPTTPVLFRDLVLQSMMKGPEAVLDQLGVQLITSSSSGRFRGGPYASDVDDRGSDRDDLFGVLQAGDDVEHVRGFTDAFLFQQSVMVEAGAAHQQADTLFDEFLKPRQSLRSLDGQFYPGIQANDSPECRTHFRKGVDEIEHQFPA